MQLFQNILYVSLGINDEVSGLKQALDLAGKNAAHLTILLLTPELPGNLADYREKFESAVIQDMQSALAKAADSLNIDTNAIDYSIMLDHDTKPAIRTIRTVLKHGHNLVIKEATTRQDNRGFRSIDMSLLRKCPCPVWLCRPIAKPHKDINLAVAIDPGDEEGEAVELSKQMLEMASTLSDSYSGYLQIVACWDYEYEAFLRHNPWAPVPEHKIQDALRLSQSEHRERLTTLTEKAGIPDGAHHQVNQLHGRPDTLIPQFVEDHDIDILVMGTLARTGIPGITIGNTAENILQTLSSFLLALKPSGFVTPVKAND